MTKGKPWWKSRTVWGGVLVAATQAAPQLFPTPQVVAIAQGVGIILAAVGLRPQPSPAARARGR